MDEMGTCIICGKQFRRYRRDHKYCSDQCTQTVNLSMLPKWDEDNLVKCIKTIDGMYVYGERYCKNVVLHDIRLGYVSVTAFQGLL